MMNYTNYDNSCKFKFHISISIAFSDIQNLMIYSMDEVSSYHNTNLYSALHIINDDINNTSIHKYKYFTFINNMTLNVNSSFIANSVRLMDKFIKCNSLTQEDKLESMNTDLINIILEYTFDNYFI
jgi:beta-xylosidase